MVARQTSIVLRTSHLELCARPLRWVFPSYFSPTNFRYRCSSIFFPRSGKWSDTSPSDLLCLLKPWKFLCHPCL